MASVAVRKPVGRLDLFFLVLILLLTTVGILSVFDASYPFALAHRIPVTKFVGQQALWGVMGIIALLVASHFEYWKWRNFATIAVSLSIILLVAVFVPHVGIMENGAHRWVGHGSFRIQPSEFAKFAIILFVARSCAGNPKIMRHFLIGPGPGLCATTIVALLIAREPDLGTSLLIAGTGFAILFFAGMKRRHLALVLLITVLIVVGVFTIKAGHKQSSYQISRIWVFLNPEKYKLGDGFQVYHSTLALGTGGLMGEGIGLGREKLDLPEAYTDFIFAVVGEEGGLIAGIFIIALYSLIVARGMHIACTTTDRFGALMAAGISFSIGIQAVVNIGGVTASLPATGVPLPGISYGGSSLFLTLLMAGILLNIGRYPMGNPRSLKNHDISSSERDFNRRRPVTDYGASGGNERSPRKRSTIRTAY